jgi:hypothetical protein
MFKLGVATSIAQKSRYSWPYTVDFCIRNNLSLIQFYWQYPVPLVKKSQVLNIPTRYLHLPSAPDSSSSILNLSVACSDFIKLYRSDKVIIHQQDDDRSGSDETLIAQLNDLGCKVGIENHRSESLTGYQSSLYTWYQKQYKIFAVIDVHKFFNRFYQVHSAQEILQAVTDLFLCCRELKLTLVLHIIDSRSFNSNRELWCPVFEGVVPYTQIFNIMKNLQVDCEGFILEYEDEIMTIESIRRLRPYII